VTDDVIPLTREYTVDAGYTGRVAWVLVKRIFLRRPSTWLGAAAAVGAIVLALLGVDPMWWVAGALVFVTVLFPAFVYLATRRAFSKRFPVGTLLATGFGEQRFRSDGPNFSSNINYTFFSRAERDGEFVALKQVTPKAWSYFPGVLFGDEDLARFPVSPRR